MKEYVKDNYYYFIIFTLIIWLGYKYLLVVFILLILTITIVNIINSYPITITTVIFGSSSI
jgi:hypothetical protein